MERRSHWGVIRQDKCHPVPPGTQARKCAFKELLQDKRTSSLIGSSWSSAALCDQHHLKVSHTHGWPTYTSQIPVHEYCPAPRRALLTALCLIFPPNRTKTVSLTILYTGPMFHMLEAMQINFMQTSLAQTQGELTCPLSTPSQIFSCFQSTHLPGIIWPS